MATQFERNRQQDNEKRAELAKDLRKEHFILGYETSFPKESKYAESMKQHALTDFGATKEEMNKLRKDLRREHYQLGTDRDAKKLFQTTATNDFVPYENAQRSKLSLETKKDLRSCHFVLGNDKPAQQSDYKMNFKEKSQEIFQDRKAQANKLRQHHPVFSDDKNYYSSLYNETTNKQYDKSFLKQGKTKDQITEQIVQLRKTNLLIGSNPVQYDSEAQTEFSNKGYARNDLLDMNLKTTNYVLGTDTDIYKTTVRETFKGEFQLPDKGKTQELVADLRKEHYTLGNDPKNYVSQNKSTFVEHGTKALLEKPDLSELYKTHYRMGGVSQDIATQQRYQSDYKSQFLQKDRIINQSLRNDRTDRASNIVLGSDQNNEQFVSEAKDQMKDVDTKAAKQTLNQDLAKDLRGTHYKFGNDKAPMISQNQDIYRDTLKQKESATLDAELKKDLRRNHFEYGTQQNDYQPIQSDIGKYQGQPSTLNPKLAKDLRSHHFAHGNYGLSYETSYKKNHIDFTKD